MDQPTPRTMAAITRQEQQLIRHSTKGMARSMTRQVILSEDEYIAGLERTIARLFFPAVSEELERKERQRVREEREREELMQGFHSEDPDIIERSVRRLEEWAERTPRGWETDRSSRRRENAETPRGFSADTPMQATPLTHNSKKRKAPSSPVAPPRYDTGLTLDEYQAKYTSEDNASFAEIMTKENEARRAKYAWAYNAEQAANDKANRAIQARERLVDLARRIAEGDEEVRMIEGAEAGRPGARLLIEGRKNLPGDRASIENAKRRLIAAPSKQERLLIEGSSSQTDAVKAGDNASNSGQILSQTPEERERQLKASMQDTSSDILATRDEGDGRHQAWQFTARNSLHFAPDANVPIHDSDRKAQAAAKAARAGLDGIDGLGLAAPKGINYSQTRMMSEQDRERDRNGGSVPPSPSHSNIAAAINGTPYPGRPGGESMTPRVRGFSFVDDMPSPSPSTLGDSGLNSLMTFGTLASTPIALRGHDEDDDRPSSSSSALAAAQQADVSGPGPFKIPATPRREALAHKLAGKATKSLQQRHGIASSASSHTSGLGLRKHVSGGSASPFGRDARSVLADALSERDTGNASPREAFLSPAAKSLLGRSTGRTSSGGVLAGAGKTGASTGSPRFDNFPASAAAREREKRGLEKLKRAKWEPSPLSK